MANSNSSQPVPRDAPWKLAATTKSLAAPQDPPVAPSGSTVSVFTYVPTLETLDQDYPDDRLVYIKLGISIAPDTILPSGNPNIQPLVSEGLPVWTSIVDARIYPDPHPEGGFNLYFLSAAPVRREMIQTGIVGEDLYEGEVDGVAMSKSGTTLSETFQSKTKTKTSGWWYLIGSREKVGTGISGTRDVAETVDVTQRIATDERRDLMSSYADVKNVLTLLSTKHIGSPYLQFALRPRPLMVLSALTGSDGWYQQFLERRSSGIEGMQDFYAIAVIPRQTIDFCVSVTLRNVYVYDVLPSPPVIAGDSITNTELAQIEDYLIRRYPPGTPIDELDIDLRLELDYRFRNTGAGPARIDQSKDANFTVEGWWFYPGSGPQGDYSGGWAAVLISAARIWWDGWGVKSYSVAYKRLRDVWLELQQEKYLQRIVQSPLVDGVVFQIAHVLNVCFSQAADGTLTVTGYTSNTKDPVELHPPIHIDTSYLDYWVSTFRNWQRPNFIRATQAWNGYDAALLASPALRGSLTGGKFDFGSESVVDAFIRRLSTIERSNPLNGRLSDEKMWLSLPTNMVGSLERAGITDVRGLATAISNIEAIAKMTDASNARFERIERAHREEGVPADQSVATPQRFAVLMRDLRQLDTNLLIRARGSVSRALQRSTNIEVVKSVKLKQAGNAKPSKVVKKSSRKKRVTRKGR